MLFLHDRLSNKRIKLTDIIEDKKLRIYMCGPTLYRKPHLGNFRCVIFIDFIIALMQQLGIEINIYASITDIGHCFDNSDEDKVLAHAQAQKIHYYNVVDRFYREYISVLQQLNIKLSYINFIAASSLEQEYMQHLNLVTNNPYTYLDNNNNIKVKQEFIDRHKPSLIFGGSRLQEFVLWKADNLGIYQYNKTAGNPGWHMECFSIIKKFFSRRHSSYIDIHIGGIDLLDIHNNAEIIHSKLEDEANNIAKLWTAVGTITLNGHKMSKSENNVVYIADFIKAHNISILKLIILNSNYESNIDLNADTIQHAINIYNRIIDNIAKLIFDQYTNPQTNIHNIMADIVQDSHNLSLDNIYYTLDTRSIINNMLKSNNIVLIYKLDLLLNTQIFQIFLERQKQASQLYYICQKRQELKQVKNFIEADHIKDKILAHNLKLMEQSGIFFIY